LQRVILAFLRRGFSHVQVVRSHRGHLLGVARCEKQLANMAHGKIIDQVDNTADREQPAKKEMPAASGCERVVAGHSQPTREGAAGRAENALLDTEKTSGVDFSSVKIDKAACFAVILAGADGKKSPVGI